jgi:hypothetical protein
MKKYWLTTSKTNATKVMSLLYHGVLQPERANL